MKKKVSFWAKQNIDKDECCESDFRLRQACVTVGRRLESSGYLKLVNQLISDALCCDDALLQEATARSAKVLTFLNRTELCSNNNNASNASYEAIHVFRSLVYFLNQFQRVRPQGSGNILTMQTRISSFNHKFSKTLKVLHTAHLYTMQADLNTGDIQIMCSNLVDLEKCSNEISRFLRVLDLFDFEQFPSLFRLHQYYQAFLSPLILAIDCIGDDIDIMNDYIRSRQHAL